MCMSFIAVTDNDQALTDDVAQQLARAAWDLREPLNHGGTAVDDAWI